MGELGLNKIFGALLATALGMMALIELPKVIFGDSAAHHGDDHGEVHSLSEKMCAQFHYCVEIAEAASAGAVEDVFDLGAALAIADLSRGERLFAGQCATCHTITPGGANGTGPNLHNTVGASKAHIAGFNYSAAMNAAEGEWSYENLDAWLKAPASYVRGTSMSFAGVKRDQDRANVIAYLAANTENAPAFPEPRPAAEEAPADGEAVPADTAAEPGEGETEATDIELPPAEGEIAPAEEVEPT
ncbi:MAG TPA: cytochrome c family protein [Hyphomonas sp.]|nr:cytochrome c family protein [Hyphomonas sp.]HRJ00234.1 cytochrome c family protein [Hyphomonas sp.]HRK68871.1 cytochrome c family protein [Hyphomonas sp.]